MPSSDVVDRLIDNNVEPSAANVMKLVNLSVMMRGERVRFGLTKPRPTDESEIGVIACLLTEEDTPRAYVVHFIVKYDS